MARLTLREEFLSAISLVVFTVERRSLVVYLPPPAASISRLLVRQEKWRRGCQVSSEQVFSTTTPSTLALILPVITFFQPLCVWRVVQKGFLAKSMLCCQLQPDNRCYWCYFGSVEATPKIWDIAGALHCPGSWWGSATAFTGVSLCHLGRIISRSYPNPVSRPELVPVFELG